jgi:hypothetical protein
MKEKILEILKDNPFVDWTDDDKAAEDITAMVFEFVEWLIREAYSKQGLDEYEKGDKLFWYNAEEDKDYTLEEIFNYWLTNIYKK